MTSEAVAGKAVCHPRNFSGRVVTTRSDSNSRWEDSILDPIRQPSGRVVMFWTEPLVLQILRSPQCGKGKEMSPTKASGFFWDAIGPLGLRQRAARTHPG